MEIDRRTKKVWEIDQCYSKGGQGEVSYFIMDIMVKFSILQSAKVSDVKALNVTKDVTMEMKILALIKDYYY